jgi:polysaccharide biosynthesis transport protein
LRGYAQGTGLISPSERDTSVAEQRLRLVGEELARAQADRIARQSRQELASAANPEWLPQVLENPVARDYQTKLTDLRRQSEQLKALLTPENYKVQQVENEIKVLQAARDKEFADMQKRFENEYQAALSREKLLQERFDRQSAQVSDEAARSIHYNTLKQELETTRTLRSQVLEKAQQLSLAAASPTGGLRILGTATPPTRPYRPNYLLNLLLALFAGTFAGVVLAVTREHRRPTLRSPGETQSLLRLPELAAIPTSNGGKTHALTEDLDSPADRLALAAAAPQPSLLMESIHDALGSLVSRCDQGPSVIVFTSPASGDGKTTITANLAIALAHANRRVLLVDGDLRRSRLHKIFRVASNHGFGELLREGLHGSLEGIVANPLSIPNLSLLPAGQLGKSANAPVLSSGRLPGLIARLRSEYDIVLIDTPPVLQGPDARILGRLADGVILVVRSRKTTHVDATAALLRLASEGVMVAGTILNDWNPRSDSAPYTYQPKGTYAAASSGGD